MRVNQAQEFVIGGAKGAALQASEAVFSEAPGQIVCEVSKGVARNLGRETETR
jgi:hypothetical protein